MYCLFLLGSFFTFSKGYEFFAKGNDSIGGKYWKALYIEYKDQTFSTVKEKEDHLGFLGPVIRAEVGDTIMVTFKNKTKRFSRYSMKTV